MWVLESIKNKELGQNRLLNKSQEYLEEETLVWVRKPDNWKKRQTPLSKKCTHGKSNPKS